MQEWFAMLARGVITLAALCASLLVGASSASAHVALPPDLVTLDKGTIRLCQEAPGVLKKKDACRGSGRVMVRLASFVANRGPGPLEYTPAPPEADQPSDCHGDGDVDLDGDGVPDDNDVVVQQRVFEDVNQTGSFERPADTASTTSPVGCRYYHAEHDHYHVEAFAEFMLRNEKTMEIERAGGKISFCVGDSGSFGLDLPGAPANPFYDISSCGGQRTTQGISPGWYDLYGWSLSGQQIDVTGMPAGTYCLIARADPNNLIEESNESNNDRLVRLAIDPSKAPLNSYANLKRQKGGCVPLS